jgi:hypothetical protein
MGQGKGNRIFYLLFGDSGMRPQKVLTMLAVYAAPEWVRALVEHGTPK